MPFYDCGIELLLWVGLFGSKWSGIDIEDFNMRELRECVYGSFQHTLEKFNASDREDQIAGKSNVSKISNHLTNYLYQRDIYAISPPGNGQTFNTWN